MPRAKGVSSRADLHLPSPGRAQAGAGAVRWSPSSAATVLDAESQVHPLRVPTAPGASERAGPWWAMSLILRPCDVLLGPNAEQNHAQPGSSSAPAHALPPCVTCVAPSCLPQSGCPATQAHSCRPHTRARGLARDSRHGAGWQLGTVASSTPTTSTTQAPKRLAVPARRDNACCIPEGWP